MKVCNGRFGGAANHVGKLPTHGVYHRAMWELAKGRAVALSLHSSFNEGMTAAAKYELVGAKCMLVCFVEDSPATIQQPETKATERRAQS